MGLTSINSAWNYSSCELIKRKKTKFVLQPHGCEAINDKFDEW